jgi:GNAT superfamily N-acetyltransferase
MDEGKNAGADDAITIRRAGPADHAGMGTVLEELDALHRAHAPWLFVKPDVEPRPLRYLEPFFLGVDHVAFVATTDQVIGVAMGIVRATPDFPIMRRAQYVVLDGIAVLASHRRRGIGQRLTRAIEDWAAARAEWVELGVYDFNDGAARFYESLGYTALRRTMRKAMASRP